MPRLTLAEVDAARRTRFASALLFITDRCPVGCAHCSVDSRRDSPRITDFALFGEIVDALCAVPEFRVIGVSGGEPFVERRGLQLAARAVTDAGKHLVLYTSGVWAGTDGPAPWVTDVLRRASCVVLGTDAFHAERLSGATVRSAIRAVADAGAWLAAQVVDEPDQLAAAERQVAAALGPAWREHAEIRPVPLLPYGRAAGMRRPHPRTPGRGFGRCDVVDAPVVRYDGQVLACCNEAVVTGRGPAALRHPAGDRAGVLAALRTLRDDPYFRGLGRHGLGVLIGLPRYRDLADKPFLTICEPCWAMLDRGAQAVDPAVRALDLISTDPVDTVDTDLIGTDGGG